ncbi:hypothetical protein H6F67_14445 [Microcoleus sp. FACHB-1515]|uniref:hypothetical protein n=1 Tax=Cyanophyceae TaxID=3028117 RepID=UPI001688971A|nr:hypothetical protein [Microcoleus sp. FACHB-1515]MBD2091050.1 hypothetical protein [Microcoleus sp. FACHB-1515]
MNHEFFRRSAALALVAASLLAPAQMTAAQTASAESDAVLMAQSDPNRGHFSLAIMQAQPSYPNLIARVSLLTKRPDAFLQERFIGDFRYRMNQQAQFIRGLNPGDRVVIRLFTPQNQLIGYTEAELLPNFASINLVLPTPADSSRTIRTVYGSDTDQNGAIDAGSVIYDYFTRVTGDQLATSRATFLSEHSQPSSFQMRNLPAPTAQARYPDSFATGNFSLAGRTIAVFDSNLAPALVAVPGAMVQPTTLSNGTSVYEASRLILAYRSIGVSQGRLTETIDAPPEGN